MGFHRRYISKEHILSKYKHSGIDGVHRLFRADSLHLNDDFSRKVHELLINCNIIELKNKIKCEIKTK